MECLACGKEADFVAERDLMGWCMECLAMPDWLPPKLHADWEYEWMAGGLEAIRAEARRRGAHAVAKMFERNPQGD